MSEVPPEVLTNILSRLPVKPLLRFRCVSKPWCALIDNPHFINSHLNHSLQTNSNRTLLLKSHKVHSIDVASLDEAIQVNQPMDFNEFSRIVGSCNGLLCLCQKFSDIYILWNPSTHSYQKLPATGFSWLDGAQALNFGSGFGYDHVNDDYKVVSMMQFSGEGDVTFQFKVLVYSLKSNSWHKIRDFPYKFVDDQRDSILASGALHWIVNRETESNCAGLIAAFDLETEEYGLVPLPDYSDKNFRMRVEVLEGCLCLLCNFDSPQRIDIWVMKNYGVKESWTKLICTSSPTVITVFEAVKPLVYSKSGEQILWEFANAMLIWTDHKRRTVENFRVRGLPNHFYSNVYVGSLVRINGSHGSDKKKQQAKEKEEKKKKVCEKKGRFPVKGFQTGSLSNWKII